MAFRYSKEHLEAQLIKTRECLISFPQYRGVLTNDIKECEETLKRYHPDSKLLHLCTIKSPTSSAFIGSKGNSNHAIDKCEGVIKEPTAETSVIPCKKAKKKAISATIKKLVWNTNIGEDIGKSKCMCCQSTDITQLSFNCGHVVAEAKGGATIVSNLKPICQNCNSSMGTTNMNEFMQSLK
jgi:hypothetical protein